MDEYAQRMVEMLLSILDPIESHERARLREIATGLKQMDSKHWAVGEMLERGCIFLDAYEMTSRNST